MLPFKVVGLANGDFNGVQRVGCGDYQFLIRDGVRDSSAVAYLPPNQRAGGTGRSTVRPQSLVTKILFNQTANGTEAVGVQFVDTSQGPPSASATVFTAGAKREVCSGLHHLIASSHLFAVSGV